jgi:hypothetical protein
MDFNDDKRCDLIKVSIKNEDLAQRVEGSTIRNHMHMDWSKDDDYLGGESILDISACDNTNWDITVDPEDGHILKVESKINEEPLIDLAKNHPRSNVRISAISHITDHIELSNIIRNDPDIEVRKAGLERLEELYVK